MRNYLLNELEYFINEHWTYDLGKEDMVSHHADCSGFIHLCMVALGVNIPRHSSLEWYDHSYPRFEFPSVVSVPGHMALLISGDLVLEITGNTPEGSNALRTVSYADWSVSVARLGEPRFYSLRRLRRERIGRELTSLT